MRQLNYVPNPSARSLTLGTGHIIALVVPDISNPFYSEIARGVQDICDAAGYNLMISSTDGRREKELAAVRGFAKYQIDGVCFVRYLVDEEALRLLAERDIPTVVIGRPPSEEPMDSVGTFGTGKALRTIISSLVSAGRRRLGYVGGPPESIVGSVRHAHFKQMVEQYQLDDDPDLAVESDFSWEGGRLAATRLFSLEHPPDMVFAANDLIAIGTLEAAEQLGLHVPQDVAVIGCDDVAFASVLRPSLTSIRLPTFELGSQAAELLLDRIDDPKAPIRQRSLEASPVMRSSTRIDATLKSKIADSGHKGI